MKKLFALLLLILGASFYFTISAQETTVINTRVYEKYTPQQLEEIKAKHPAKIGQLNFYFTKSFRIVPPVGQIEPSMTPAEVDITQYEHLRKKSERAQTGLRRDGHSLELLSHDELKAAYERIVNSTK